MVKKALPVENGRTKNWNSEMAFYCTHGPSGLGVALLNGKTLDGKLLCFDDFAVLVQHKERKYLIRKSAVKYVIALGEPAVEPNKALFQEAFEETYWQKQINENQPMRFIFEDGNGIVGTPIGYTKYTLTLESQGVSLLLPKHAFIYAHTEK